jgi:hypothetical protein
MSKSQTAAQSAAISAAIRAMMGDTAFAPESAQYAEACKVFELADNSSASFAARLAAIGLDDRAAAKPVAMAWAAQKYEAVIEAGQRGFKLPRDSAAEKAMYRVLDVCFPREEAFSVKSSDQADPVAALLKSFGKKYDALTPGQKRSVKAGIKTKLSL